MRRLAPLIALLVLTACGGSAGFDADAARDVLNDRAPGMSAVEREDAVAAMKDGCDSDNVEAGMAELVTSDLPAAVLDAMVAGCPEAADVLDDMNVGEVVAQDGACEAAYRTIDVALQAWYATTPDENPSSITDLVDAGFVSEDSGLEDYVEVVEGQPATVEFTDEC